jgi:hypothetical protein
MFKYFNCFSRGKNVKFEEKKDEIIEKVQEVVEEVVEGVVEGVVDEVIDHVTQPLHVMSEQVADNIVEDAKDNLDYLRDEIMNNLESNKDMDESSALIEPVDSESSDFEQYDLEQSNFETGSDTDQSDSDKESDRVNSLPELSLEHPSNLDSIDSIEDNTFFEIPLTTDSKSPVRPGTPIPGFKKNDE